MRMYVCMYVCMYVYILAITCIVYAKTCVTHVPRTLRTSQAGSPSGRMWIETCFSTEPPLQAATADTATARILLRAREEQSSPGKHPRAQTVFRPQLRFYGLVLSALVASCLADKTQDW